MQLLIPVLFLLAAGVGTAAPDFHQAIHQGQAALAKSDIAGAAHLFEQACGEQTGSLPPDELASCDHHLAVVDQAHGDLAMAEKRLRKALLEWQAAGEAFQPAYAMSLLNLGELCRAQRRFGEAEDYLTRAVAIARASRTAFPQEYPSALSRLAGLYADSDRADLGKSTVQEALSIFRGLTPRQPAEEARALNALGGIELGTGPSSEAHANLEEAVNLASAVLGPDHPDTAAYQADLALYYIRYHQYDRAEPLLRRARFVVESNPYPNYLRLGTIVVELAIVACDTGKYGMAQEYSRQSQAILARAPSVNPAAGLLARVTLGSSWLKANKLKEAEQVLPGAIEDERRIAPGTCLLADGLRDLGELRARQNSTHEAKALYQEAIEIYQKRLGPENPNLSPLLREYAGLLKRMGGSKAEAKAIESRAKAISSFAPPA